MPNRERLPAALQLSATGWLRLLVSVECGSQIVLTVGAFDEAVYFWPSGNCKSDLSPAACGSTYFWTASVAIGIKWLVTQLPARLVAFPELVRSAVYVALHLGFVARLQPAALTQALVAEVVLRAVCGALLVPLLVALCHHPVFKRLWLHDTIPFDTCPRALAPARDALCGACERFAEWLVPGDVLIEYNSVLGVEAGAVLLHLLDSTLNVTAMTRSMNVMIAAAAALSLASKRRAGSAAALRLMQQRMGLSAGGTATPTPAWRMAAAGSEQELLRVAQEALYGLFPGAMAQAVATLDDGRVACFEVAAATQADRRALTAALPRHEPLVGDGSSVAFVCAAAAARGCVVAHSDDWQPAGVTAFADWDAATQSGLAAERMVTARIAARGATVGFLVLAFPADGGFASSDGDAAEALRAFAEAVADAVVARRAKDEAERNAREHTRMQALARDIYPQHLLFALSERNMRAAAPASEAPDAAGMLTDHHDDVTCIFADCVGFTRIAAALSPEDAMHLLDRLFQKFDSLTTAHGVYKARLLCD